MEIDRLKRKLRDALLVEGCRCGGCVEVVNGAVARKWTCSACGYEGPPIAIECASWAVSCPVCEGGNADTLKERAIATLKVIDKLK